MKDLQKQKSALGQTCCLLILALLIGAQFLKAREPLRYEMQLVCAAEDTGARESYFVIGTRAFKSLASLKRFAGALPKGSRLEWAPGCRQGCEAPFLSSKGEIDEFTEFCRQKGVSFVFVPSG